MQNVHTDPKAGNEANNNGIALRQTPKRLPAIMGWTWMALACSIFLDRLGKWLLITVFFCISFYYFIKFSTSNWWPAIFIFYPVAGLIVIYSTVYYSASQIEEDHLDISAFLSFCRKKFKDLLILGILQTFCIFILTSLLYLIVPFLSSLFLLFFGWLLSLLNIESFTSNRYADLTLLSIIFVAGTGFITTFIAALITLTVAGLPSPLAFRHSIPPLRAIRMGISSALTNIRPLLMYLLTLSGLDLIIRLLSTFLFFLLPATFISIINPLSSIIYFSLLLVFNSLISYVFYLTVWTDAEWEF